MRRDRDDEGNQIVRKELKYCERCGGLWLRECGAGVVYCEKCEGEIAELPIPKKKPRRVMRVALPIGRRVLIDELPSDELPSDEKEFEAAGGVA